MNKFISAILILCIIMSLFSGCVAETSMDAKPATVATIDVANSVSVTKFSVAETEATEPIAEEISCVIDEVPKYNQLEYTCPYGDVIIESTGQQATVRNSGCGITCLAMVATYLLDDPSLTPDVLAEQFGRYNTNCGSAWSLFLDSAEVLGLGEVKQVCDWNIGNVEEALRNGSLVISNQRGGIFTTGGHYILLTGITEDGKVMVHDPNGANWTRPDIVDSLENGFEYTDISWSSSAYWIYTPKSN